ncbi:hypothetical protein F5884DRAFT_85616 [Xylogone sp. PMI_703]|nr:hypothetical protein F5884DRAFT_85616 [Xylogone sp. PMI_703]
MADPTPLASLSLTHVHYDPDDPISYACAFMALVPQALCVVYATLIWSTREIEIFLMFCGQMACEASNFALKRILKEERPKQMHGKGYGMPSSHAQFVAFFSVSLTLFLLLRHVPREKSANYRPLYLIERLGLSVLALMCAGLVAWSRVYLSYHTPKQVLVGVAAGTVTAIGWFLVVTAVRRLGLLQFFLELPLIRFFRVRDLVVEEDLSQAGWEKWEARRLASQTNVNGKKVR